MITEMAVLRIVDLQGKREPYLKLPINFLAKQHFINLRL